MSTYTLHALATVFPEMGSKDYSSLRDDIIANGLKEPITLYQGQILDGRHRYDICVNNNIEPKYQMFDGDPIKYVRQKNLHRRHLTDDQRIKVERDLREMQYKAQNQVPDDGVVSDNLKDEFSRAFVSDSPFRLSKGEREEIASDLGVSERQVQKVDMVMRRSPDDVIEAMGDGIIPVYDALANAAEDTDIQIEAVQRVSQGDATTFGGAIKDIKQERDDERVITDHYLTHLDVPIYNCSVGDVAQYVEPRSVDLLICEPPEGYKFYTELAELADQVLSDRGTMAIIVSPWEVLETAFQVEEGGNCVFRWVGAYPRAGDLMFSGQRIKNRMYLILLYTAQDAVGLKTTDDYWEREPSRSWYSPVESLACDAGLVLDPMCSDNGKYLLIAKDLGHPVVGASEDMALVARLKKNMAD